MLLTFSGLLIPTCLRDLPSKATSETDDYVCLLLKGMGWEDSASLHTAPGTSTHFQMELWCAVPAGKDNRVLGSVLALSPNPWVGGIEHCSSLVLRLCPAKDWKGQLSPNGWLPAAPVGQFQIHLAAEASSCQA